MLASVSPFSATQNSQARRPVSFGQARAPRFGDVQVVVGPADEQEAAPSTNTSNASIAGLAAFTFASVAGIFALAGAARNIPAALFALVSSAFAAGTVYLLGHTANKAAEAAEAPLLDYTITNAKKDDASAAKAPALNCVA